MQRIMFAGVCLLFVFFSGCATRETSGMLPGPKDSPPEPIAELATQDWKAETAEILRAEEKLVETCNDLNAWKKDLHGRIKKGFSSQDTENAGRLLFQFTSRRGVLWSKIYKYRNADVRRNDDENTARALIAAFAAAALLDEQSTKLVSCFVSDSVFADKLNEGFFTYGVEAGTFDEIFYSVTAPGNMRQLKNVAGLLESQAKREGSGVARVLSSDADCRELYDKAKIANQNASEETKKILSEKSLLIPSVANLMRQNKLADNLRISTGKATKDLYAFQGWLFNNVSDIKRPATPPVDFNPKQVQFIKSRLRPGDLLFTFTAGYMSNVFLPGKFKHGIVYVGLPEDRVATGMGMVPWPIADMPEERRAAVRRDMAYAELPTGYDADVIEAVAEGVIFNSLDYILRTHVNRLAVLRPRITDSARREFLVKVFSLRGGMYDFDFDFEDTTYQCCTEVIYRGLNGKCGIDFPLVSRMGVRTVSADDIITYHFGASQPQFDVILFAEENPESEIHGASVLEGAAAEKRLKVLMTEKSPIGMDF